MREGHVDQVYCSLITYPMLGLLIQGKLKECEPLDVPADLIVVQTSDCHRKDSVMIYFTTREDISSRVIDKDTREVRAFTYRGALPKS